MAKTWILELDGEVVEVLPAGKFRVKLKDMEVILMCYKAWKMKQSHISVIEWDCVKVEVNQYDMSQWRITYRYNPANHHPEEDEELNKPSWKWWKVKIA